MRFAPPGAGSQVRRGSGDRLGKRVQRLAASALGALIRSRSRHCTWAKPSAKLDVASPARPRALVGRGPQLPLVHRHFPPGRCACSRPARPTSATSRPAACPGRPEIRIAAAQGGRRRAGFSSAVRRSVPVRTFADWGHPPPGFVEVSERPAGRFSPALSGAARSSWPRRRRRRSPRPAKGRRRRPRTSGDRSPRAR